MFTHSKIKEKCISHTSDCFFTRYMFLMYINIFLTFYDKGRKTTEPKKKSWMQSTGKKRKIQQNNDNKQQQHSLITITHILDVKNIQIRTVEQAKRSTFFTRDISLTETQNTQHMKQVSIKKANNSVTSYKTN